MANREYILKHYAKLAQAYGLSGAMSMDDPIIRSKEIDFFLQSLKTTPEAKSILDIGCGNGFLLNELVKAFPEKEFYGVDISPELIKLAQSRNIDVRFALADMGHLQFESHHFDVVISERSVINLLSWQQQKKTLFEIVRMLKNGGYYFLSESFKEPLRNLNQARKECNLADIKISKHNCYLGNNFQYFLESIGLKRVTGAKPENELSSHFYISRVLHPVIRPEGAKHKSSLMVEFLTNACPAGIGHYSPILFQAYRKEVSNDR